MSQKCMLCNSDSNSKKIGNYPNFNWDVYFCNKCKLGYIHEDEKIIKETLTKFYSGEYWAEDFRKNRAQSSFVYYKKKFFHKVFRFLRFVGIAAIKTQFHYNILSKHKKAKSNFLEIGPGNGDTMLYFHKKGYNVFGYEPDEVQAAKINSLFNKKVCLAENVETYKINEKYDIIYMSHVFEHLINPKLFLKKIKSNISDNGIIFIEVPNAGSKIGLENSLSDFVHTYHFTKESMTTLFENSGFEVIFCETYKAKSENLVYQFFSMIFKKNIFKKTKPEVGRDLMIMARKKVNIKKSIK